MASIKEEIFSFLKERHTIHPKDLRAIGHFDLYEEFSRVLRLFVALEFVAYFVGILVLLSGIIGVVNIILIVVKERTKEIGIRRALGESPWSIKKQILMESIFLTIISGMVGIIFGALVIFGINYVLDMSEPVYMFTNPSVNLGVIITALFILIISGLLAGFIPANSAIRVRPIEAIRT
jgi:putative ABC transport system permease protein